MLPDDPEIEVKPMFGNLGAFVHGNMFAGLFGADVGVRLDDAGARRTGRYRRQRPVRAGRAADGRLPEPAPGWRATPEVVAGWVERARDYVAALPPKQKKPGSRPSRGMPRA